MKTNTSLDIKVAVIGNVSAGKSTIINALYREKFTEVSNRRRTAGVSYFRLRKKRKVEVEGGHGQVEWTTEEDDIRSSASVLEEIKSDNIRLRTGASDCVEEKVFETEVNENIFEMRNDTRLVLIDVPGLNENGAGKYRKYVEAKWGSFHCVIVVMDCHQDVGTDAQVALLEFVKSNNNNITPVPVIILINKVDDMFDEDQMDVVQEFREKVEEIFLVENCEDALSKILKHAKSGTQCPEDETLYPVVIPLCGIAAFIFRSCSAMPVEKIRKLDSGTLTKLGRNQVGHLKWNKMSQDEKIESAYQIVSDPDLYQVGYDGSNFDVFLDVLAYTLGDEEKQLSLTEKQIKSSMTKFNSIGFAKELRSAHNLMSALRAREPEKMESFSKDVKEKFWHLYEREELIIFAEFKSPESVGTVSVLAKELPEYCLLARDCGWGDEVEKVKTALSNLFRKQIKTLLSRVEKEELPEGYTEPEGKISWARLDEVDWYKIFGSIALLSCDKLFCEEFGIEKILLDVVLTHLLDKIKTYSKVMIDIQCPKCKGFSDFNRFCKTCGHYLIFSFPAVSHPSYCPSEIQRCPNYTACDGYVQITQNPRYHCESVCSKYFYDLNRPALADKITLQCHKCTSGLDFNRYCRSCNIYYLPKNSIADLACCPRGDSHTSLEKGDDQVSCKSCNINFRELATALFKTVDTDEFQAIGNIQVPRTISDPNHFGHVAWLYCNLVAGLKLHK